MYNQRHDQLHMQHQRRWLIAAAVLTLSLPACSDHKKAGSPGNAGAPAAVSAEAVTDKWIGQWNGPEGTFIKIAGGQGKYQITIQNLDRPRTFQGSAAGSQIQFERDGLKESVRATNRAETGMKWLSDKSNCLTVRAGEGYCRG